MCSSCSANHSLVVMPLFKDSGRIFWESFSDVLLNTFRLWPMRGVEQMSEVWNYFLYALNKSLINLSGFFIMNFGRLNMCITWSIKVGLNKCIANPLECFIKYCCICRCNCFKCNMWSISETLNHVNRESFKSGVLF